MTRGQIEEAVLSILATLTEESLSGLERQRDLRDQLKLDSMDFLDVVMELRKRYRIDVPETDYLQLATLEGCINYLESRMTDHTP